MDHDTRIRLLRLSERRHGLLGRREVLAAGVSPEAWRNLTARDDWIAVTPRVVRRAGAPPTGHQQALAGILDVGPHAFVSHTSAAAMWGVPGYRIEPLQLMVVRGGNETETRLGTTHRPRYLPDPYAAVVDGVPVVRPSLMVLQLAHRIHPDRLRALVDRLWSRRLLSGPSLERELAPVLGRGRAGTSAIRTLLASFPADYVPPASGIESRFAALARDFDLGSFRRQADLGGDEAWCGRVDFASDQCPLIVEVQSELYHSSLTDRAADDRRRQRLVVAGFEVIEVWDFEVWHRPTLVVDRVRQAMWRLVAAA